MDSEINLLCLPNEILIYIFKLLSIKDFIALSKVCKRFDSLLHVRKITKDLCISFEYNLSYQELYKFIRPAPRRLLIECLNLNGCYWLSQKEIITILKQLKNLKEFHFIDTDLKIQNFFQISKNLKLKKVSFLWPNTHDINVSFPSFSHQLLELDSLFIVLSSFFVPQRDILQMICYCKNLTELKVIQTSVTHLTSLSAIYNSSNTVNLPHLNVLKIHLNEVCLNLFIPKILGEKWHDSDLNCLYVSCFDDPDIIKDPFLRKDNACDTEVVTLIGKTSILSIKKIECLKHLLIFKDNFQDIIEFFSSPHPTLNLKVFGLSTRNNNVSIELIDLISIFKNFSKNTLEQLVIRLNSSVKNVRFDSISVKYLAENFPNLRHFELYKADFSKEENSLNHIAKWSNLTYLTLCDITIYNLNFLSEISKKCSSLRYLALENIGLKGHFTHLYVLCQSIKNMKNLLDIRFVTPNIGQIQKLFEAFSECPNLQRIYLQVDRNIYKISSHNIIDFLDTNKNVIFFCLIYPYISQSLKNEVNSHVKFLKKTRPALITHLLRPEEAHEYLGNNMKNHFFHSLELCNNKSLLHFWPLFNEFGHQKTCSNYLSNTS